VDSQQVFRKISCELPTEKYEFNNHPRGILWRMRYYLWMGQMKLLLNFPEDFTPFTPGLEMKYALDGAAKNNSEIMFGGEEFDPITVDALKNETRMYFHTVLWRYRLFTKLQNAWASEVRDFYRVLHTRGGEAFAESMDRSRINFMVAALSKLAPFQKKIMVDLRDETIFRDLYIKCRSEKGGDKVVAVVNQWHMEGVETHWRRATKSEEKKEESPIADMDIDEYQERHIINEYLRELTSRLAKSEPATHNDMLTNYKKENFEYERTRHADHKSYKDVPGPGEKHKPHH
jgi:hypothetical protein